MYGGKLKTNKPFFCQRSLWKQDREVAFDLASIYLTVQARLQLYEVLKEKLVLHYAFESNVLVKIWSHGFFNQAFWRSFVHFMNQAFWRGLLLSESRKLDEKKVREKNPVNEQRDHVPDSCTVTVNSLSAWKDGECLLSLTQTS